MKGMKRWTQIFKALGNVSRLRIVKLLSDGQARNVSEIAREIHVTFKGTSRHLMILSNFDVLDRDGKDGHVYYSLHPNMSRDIKQALSLFLKF